MGVKKGDKIKVEYTGKLKDGTIFDSSEKHGKPLEIEVGTNQLIKGFEDALVGMEKDEEKEFTLEADQAYGQPNPDLKKKIPRANLPKDQEPKPGMMMIIGTPDGQKFPAKILEVGDEDITLDLNHPLAGKALTFKIKVVEINSSA